MLPTVERDLKLRQHVDVGRGAVREIAIGDELEHRGPQAAQPDFLAKAFADRRTAEHGARLPTMHSTMHLYAIDGAAHRVGRTDTAFSYRDANWAEVIVGVDPDPANKDKITKWCKDYFDALHPYSAGGAYVNFMMEEGHERVQASFRDNYARLAEIKKKYDPENFFRVNQNIRPA